MGRRTNHSKISEKLNLNKLKKLVEKSCQVYYSRRQSSDRHIVAFIHKNALINNFRHQMNFLENDRLLIANSLDRCVEDVSLEKKAVYTYAGLCDRNAMGVKFSGHRLDIRIDDPHGVTYDGKTSVYVGVYQMGLIYVVNTTTELADVFLTTAAGVQRLGFQAGSLLLHATLENGFIEMQSAADVRYVVGYPGGGNGNHLTHLNQTQTGILYGFTEIEEGVWILVNRNYNR